jgi:hypothetical protein
VSLFKDKQFEEMDWLSKAIEPIHADVVNVIAALPDEADIPLHQIKAFIQSEYGTHMHYNITLYLSSVLTWIAENNNVNLHDTLNQIKECFNLVVENYDEPIDFDNNTGPKFKVVKIKKAFTDQDLATFMHSACWTIVSRLNSRNLDNHSRLNEVLEMFGADTADINSKSIKRKCYALKIKWGEIMSTNAWNIKSHDLAVKASTWIVDYCERGRLDAWANLCKLKVMTYNGHPIYSLGEIE